MNKPNVLFVHYNAHSTGSAQARIIALVATVAETCSVRVLLPEEGVVAKMLREKGISVEFRSFHDNSGVLNYLCQGLSFAKYCRQNNIDLIHILDHVWWKPAELFAARLLSIPFISMITFNRPADAKAGAVRWAARIVANSNSTARDFIDAGLAEKTSVIYNAVSPEEYVSAASVRSELTNGKEFLFGYVGVLHPVKGVDVLLNAFAKVLEKHPSASLAIVGAEKKSGYLRFLESLASELSITSAVSFCGHRDDIPAVMNSFDVLVVPSREEPFGFVTIEAGAARTPLIASAVGGIPEIVRKGVDGLLVRADDVESLSNAMNRLYQDRKLASNLADSFQERVKTNFSTERMLSDWNKLYAELI